MSGTQIRPGERRAEKHGISSKQLRKPIEARYAEQIKAALVEQLGETVYNQTLDSVLVDRLARALTTVELAEKWLDEHDGDADAISERNLKVYQWAYNSIPRLVDQLGMNPQARAKLKVNTVQAENLVAKLARERRQRVVDGTSRRKQVTDGD